MVLLILPVLWAVVLLPYWVRFVRERRAERSVAAFTRRMSSLQRNATVRYVFGAYDPYRDAHDWRSTSSLERDFSYVPPARRPASAIRHAHARGLVRGDDGRVAAHDTYADDLAGYQDDDGQAYAEGYAVNYDDDLAEVQELPRVAAASAAPGAHRLDSDVIPEIVAQDLDAAGARASSRLALYRRRQIFFGLVLGFLATLGTAVWFSSIASWGVHAGAVVLLAGYVSLLVRHHQRDTERSTKVRRLAPAIGSRPARRPAVVVLSGGSAR